MLAPRSLHHMFSCVHRPRRGSFESHFCTSHSPWSCVKASAAIFDSSVFLPPRSRWFTFFWFSPLHPFPPFSVFPYICMYVRVSLGPVGACVRLCFRVAPPADTPSAPRERYSNFSSVNAIRWMRFGEWDIRISALWMRFGEWDSVNELRHRFCIGVGEWLWFVVYAPMGPGASFSETPFFRLWIRKCVCVCVSGVKFRVSALIKMDNWIRLNVNVFNKKWGDDLDTIYKFKKESWIGFDF